MNMELSDLKPLLLVGGESTRLGSRKELLPFPDGRLAIQHSLDTFRSTFSETSTIYISMHDENQLEAIRFLFQDSRSNSIIPIFDEQKGRIGPAAGLLAAHTMLPDATFLVLACDYPLLTSSALQQLSREYVAPVTCFVNGSGFAEPLIAIWGPAALEKLKENVANGRNGLHFAMKQTGGKIVMALKKEWTTGANTREEWDKAMDLLVKIVN